MPWKTVGRWTLYALAAPFVFAAFWVLIFLGPIGWVILLVLAIYDIVAMRERGKEPGTASSWRPRNGGHHDKCSRCWCSES